jgi:hypothetical protein
LPWSTWATMARLRRSARMAVEPVEGAVGASAEGMVERAVSVMGRRIVAHVARTARSRGSGCIGVARRDDVDADRSPASIRA